MDRKDTKRTDTKDEKIDINTSLLKTKKDLRKQREEETARQQIEIERQKAKIEKERQEAYEKKIHDEKIELMRMKQGVLSEEEATIHEEKEEEIKLTFGKKISNFFYHNKWWLGLGTFFVVMMTFLIFDLVNKPNPDSTILMLCYNDDVGYSENLEEYFSEFGEDSNGNGKVLVSVYYVPYTTSEFANYNTGATVKLSTLLSSNEQVIVIGDKLTLGGVFTPKDDFVDLSNLYPDDPHVEKYFYYLKDTNFAQAIGINPNDVSDDMFLAIRNPVDPINGVNEKLQETNDKDFPLFDRIIKSMSSEN